MNWHTARQKLTTDQYAVLVLRIDRGYTWGKISVALNIAPSTARSRYDAAMRTLTTKEKT